MFTLYEIAYLLYNSPYQTDGGMAVNCIRCGRETLGEQCFCEDCLLDMESYPVKPGTVVQLPPRRETISQRKQPRRKIISLEDQIKTLKHRVRTLSICLTVCFLLLVLAVSILIHRSMDDHFAIGQNYSSVTTPAADSSN